MTPATRNAANDRRCFECAWCSPTERLSPAAVCEMSERRLSAAELWHKACAQFEPLDRDLPE